MEIKLSCEACLVVQRIVKELIECKYMYRSIIEGCYDACISNYRMATPAESKDVVVDSALEALKKINDTL